MKWLTRYCMMAFLLSASATQAAPCASADLAPGFCDRNGDLLADPPDDKSQWLDPDPIIIADVPGTEVTGTEERMAPFLRHMEKAVGRKFSVFVPKDYADLIDAFKSNRAHVVNINTGGVEQEVRCDGYVPLAQPIDAQGNPAGYQMEILVRSDSALKSVRDLKGHKMTFVDEKSASGYKAPRVILAKEFGLEAGKDYSFDFSGRQDNSIMGLSNGAYEAVATASDIRVKLIQNKLVEPKAFKVLYVSKTFPHSPFGVSHRMSPSLVARLQDGFVRYSGPDKIFVNGSRFRPANYKADWAFMRELSAASGYKGACK